MPWLGVEEDLLLEPFELVEQRLSDREIAVDEAVEKGVGQVVGPRMAHGPAAAPQAGEDRFEGVVLMLPERDEPARSAASSRSSQRTMWG